MEQWRSDLNIHESAVQARARCLSGLLPCSGWFSLDILAAGFGTLPLRDIL
jgi:hypothetical protein